MFRAPRTQAARVEGIALILVLGIGACSRGHGAASAPFARTEQRQPCAEYDPLRRPWFGDLHVHTGLSWDAWLFDTRLGPADAYRFARGERVEIPPLDENGHGTHGVQLTRPIDFAAVTDHSEFLAEVQACLNPSSGVYDVSRCQIFREGTFASQAIFGLSLVPRAPQRFPAVCGEGGVDCKSLAGDVWGRTRQAAEEAYDRTSGCSFTSFVGYEWTGATAIASLHRNVIFRNGEVPALPISYYEEPSPQGLWRALREQCIDAPGACDVLAIPHNSNLSNGNMFVIEDATAGTVDELRDRARKRAAAEPLMEIYQHKGDSECHNGLSAFVGAPDELCEFEKLDPPEGATDCGEGTGLGGVIGTGLGCRSARDFARGALLAGLVQEQRIGVNPFALGFIASTDTHNATPGNVAEDAYAGHTGKIEDSPAKRLTSTSSNATLLNNPGGLAGVWAEENSRDALFEALRRRETFATSGPRIVPRFFGGWELGGASCDSPDLVKRGYAEGVPMGGYLGERPATAAAPVFVVSALRDPEGSPLAKLQIVKGWVDADGVGHYKTIDVAGSASNAAGVDPVTCDPFGPGADSLCARWVDPDFDPLARSYYYARIVENPTCRWSTRQCNALPRSERPPSCSDGSVPTTIQERAWTSPIWYRPDSAP